MYQTPRLHPELLKSPANAIPAANSSCLWILDSSPELHRKLSAARESLNAIILQPGTPCDEDTLPHHTLELIARIIRTRNVNRIIVCGQATDAMQDSGPERHSPGAGLRLYQQILHRIRSRAELRRRAQDRVIMRLEQISSHADLAYAMSLRSISLSGMFYITESDAFLHFDRNLNAFVPSTSLA